jgi:acetyltransferase-like isoleucine patch superfamily enzyme
LRTMQKAFLKHFMKLSEFILYRMTTVLVQCRSFYCTWYLRSLGAEVGHGLVMKKNAQFIIGAKTRIKIGKNLQVADGAKIYVEPDSCLTVGDGVFIGAQTTLIATFDLSIGSHSQIAHQVTITDNDHQFNDVSRPIVEQGFNKSKVIIEEDVWIGGHAVVLRGVRIGNHSVIGAGCVVTKEVPPYSVAVGNPARVISQRRQ